MISIHCTHCRQLLEMDDAFAGGVCRCQYCGTIQTVPSKSKSRSGSSKSPSSPKHGSTKALYKKGSAAGSTAPGAAPTETGVGTGLDDLAEVVASSGLSRGSLRTPPQRTRGGAAAGADAGATKAPPGPRPAKPFLTRPVLIGGGLAVAVGLIAVIFFATRPPDRGGKGTSTNTNTVTPPVVPGPDETPVAEARPSFAGIALPGADVVYVLDRSHANDAYLDAMKAAAYRSARSLGAKGRFQIVFWHRTDEGIVAYPEDEMAPVTDAEVNAAKRRFEDVVAYGTTDLKPTIEKAAASGADTVVLVTAKGFSLEEFNVDAVVDALRGRPVKVHAVSVGESESATLKQIAERTGGEYREVTPQELRTNGR